MLIQEAHRFMSWQTRKWKLW